MTALGTDSLLKRMKAANAVTYARRYSITTLLGLVTEKDDDGNEAAGRPAPKAKAAEAPTPVATPVPDGWDDEAQAQAAHRSLTARIGELPESLKADIQAFRKDNGWPLSVARFNKLEELVRVAESFAK